MEQTLASTDQSLACLVEPRSSICPSLVCLVGTRAHIQQLRYSVNSKRWLCYYSENTLSIPAVFNEYNCSETM